ncbi:MAG TPA: RsmE family RNA methyltransferase [Polyangiaceae bacterium]|jgi:RsmE family RNA methyltransferase|nr:RsmE family RNA methyltransferase [Polyangiaceae bacterium]
MNLLLLTEQELSPEAEAVLEGRRARHLLDVLGVEVGQELRAGMLNASYGVARVLATDGQRVRVVYRAVQAAVGRPERCLVLAIPRPKVLSRCLEHASALGYETIVLLRTARVEKSHLGSHKLTSADIEPHLISGLEQGARVMIPKLHVATRFRPFVEDELDTLVSSRRRFVAHPHATSQIAGLAPLSADYCLAIGPEGGFVPFEIELLQQRGFEAVSAAMGPLRVESALSYLTGQLDLLQQRAG